MKTFCAIAALLFCVTAAVANPIPVGPEYDTLDELLAHNTVANINSKSYVVKGRHAVGDGLEGLFYWVAGSTAATNNVSVFAWGNGRIFKMARWDRITPFDFGAVGNGIADDYGALQDTINAAQGMAPANVIYCPPAIYACSVGLEVTKPITIYGDNMNGEFLETTLVGPEIRYTGTNYAINVNTPRFRIWGIRVTSTANAQYGIKLKGEEGYIDHVVVGSDLDEGFKVGIYADNASLSSINESISSDNTQIGVQLDDVTGACSGVLFDRLHVYNSPIGIKMSVNLNVMISSLIEESCQKGIYWDNTAAHGEGLTAQNIVIEGAKYLQVPSAPPAFYTEGRFLYFDAAAASGRFMSIRNLIVRDCFVDNQAATYDVEARFGSNTPLVSGVIFENTHFIGSTNSVVVSDNGQFTPTFLNNTMVAPRVISRTNGAALYPSPFWVQGNGSILVGNATNQIRILADASGTVFLQPGLGNTDTNATFTMSLRDTAATAFKAINIYANIQELRANEVLIDDTNSVSGLRFVANSSGQNFIQAGKAGGGDTNAILVLSLRDSTNNVAQLHFHGNSTVFWKADGNTNFWMAPDTGWTGTGTKSYRDNGTFQTDGGGGGGGITNNTGANYVPYWSGSALTNSPFYRISDNKIGFNSTTQFMVVTNDNVAIGNGSGALLDGGALYLTAVGHNALGSSGGSVASSAFGESALGLALGNAHDNTAIGAFSLSAVTTGAENTSVGRDSGITLTTQNGNTFVGFSAGGGISGSYNTIVGHNSGASAISITNAIGIGEGVTATNSNDVVIGNLSNQNAYLPPNVYAGGILLGGGISTNIDQLNVGAVLVTNGIYAGSLVASNTITLGGTTLTNFLATQTTLTHAGTITLDLTPLTQHADLSLTGNVTFATVNLIQGHALTVFGKNPQATNCTPTFPVGWTNWMGGTPTTITAQKSFVISLLSRATTDGSVYTAYAESP